MNEEEHLEFENNFKNALRGILLSFQSPALQYMPWSNLRRTCVEAARVTRETAKNVVLMRQNDLNAGKIMPEDPLSYVFKLKEALPECDIEDLVDMVVTLIFGGN